MLLKIDESSPSTLVYILQYQKTGTFYMKGIRNVVEMNVEKKTLRRNLFINLKKTSVPEHNQRHCSTDKQEDHSG